MTYFSTRLSPHVGSLHKLPPVGFDWTTYRWLAGGWSPVCTLICFYWLSSVVAPPADYTPLDQGASRNGWEVVVLYSRRTSVVLIIDWYELNYTSRRHATGSYNCCVYVIALVRLVASKFGFAVAGCTVCEVVAAPVLCEDVNINGGWRKLTDKCVTTGRRGEALSRTSKVAICQKSTFSRKSLWV